MASVRIDATTAATLKRLSARRGQTQSAVVRDAIARLAEEEGEQLSAYQRLGAFIGVVDSGGKQLSENTGRQLSEFLVKKRKNAGRPT